MKIRSKWVALCACDDLRQRGLAEVIFLGGAQDAQECLCPKLAASAQAVRLILCMCRVLAGRAAGMRTKPCDYNSAYAGSGVP